MLSCSREQGVARGSPAQIVPGMRSRRGTGRACQPGAPPWLCILYKIGIAASLRHCVRRRRRAQLVVAALVWQRSWRAPAR
eukprot:3403260-Pyramimonas_sp.AAC.1